MTKANTKVDMIAFQEKKSPASKTGRAGLPFSLDAERYLQFTPLHLCS